MKLKILLLIFSLLLFLTTRISAQQAYYDFVKQADSLYKAKDYKNSAFTYSKAFKVLGWKGYQEDRYNAARAWARADYPDSAIFQLNKIATKLYFSEYNKLTADSSFYSLHGTKRWNALLKIVNSNDKKKYLYKQYGKKLDSVFDEDQRYRKQTDSIGKIYGHNSAEMKNHVKVIVRADSLNLIIIQAILDKYGWAGPEEIGQVGSKTLFLVIQHSGIVTQEKYLPMMRNAVKHKKALGSDLALLEDRVALRTGKKQIYGSQIGMYPDRSAYYVSPLLDPDNVDKRRAEVGLGPLADYVSHWGIKWDVEQYKKDLPKFEELERK